MQNNPTVGLASVMAAMLISKRRNHRTNGSRSTKSDNPFDPESSNHQKLKDIALKALAKKSTFDEVKSKQLLSKDPIVVKLAKRADSFKDLPVQHDHDFSDYTSTEFVVFILYRAGKPISENLIHRRIRQNEAPLTVPRINMLLASTCMSGITKYEHGKGYRLSEKMLELIANQVTK